MAKGLIAREACAHTAQWVERRRQATSRFYASRITEDMWRCFDALISRSGARHVLEYGCGAGLSFDHLLGLGVEQLIGIDIAPEMVHEARQRIAELAASDRIRAYLMDAHSLEFADNSFDLIIGVSILHHLDLEAACLELRRVLSPNGTAVFIEPLGMNPVINRYRARTPQYRTTDEYPLTCSDLDMLRRLFLVESRFFVLSVLLASFRGLYCLAKPLRLLDRVLLKIPRLQLLAWMVVLRLQAPAGDRARQ